MLKPFYNDASGMEVFDCLEHFNDTTPPTREAIERYIRARNYMLAKARVVEWFWYGRHYSREHPAAYEILRLIPYDSPPTEPQFMKALRRLKEKILATPDSYDEEQIFKPLIIGAPSTLARPRDRHAVYNRQAALDQLNKVTFEEAARLWEALKHHQLPPFAPPLGDGRM
jgi:hypothetical protein